MPTDRAVNAAVRAPSGTAVSSPLRSLPVGVHAPDGAPARTAGEVDPHAGSVDPVTVRSRHFQHRGPAPEALADAIATMSRILGKACEKHPAGMAGVARHLGISKQLVHRWCAPADAATMPEKYLPLLPPKVRAAYLDRLDQELHERPDAERLPPEERFARVVSEIGDVARAVVTLRPGGLTSERRATLLREVDEAHEQLDLFARELRTAP